MQCHLTLHGAVDSHSLSCYVVLNSSVCVCRFVFVMGTSIAMSFNTARRRGLPQSQLLCRVARRTVILFILGLTISNRGTPCMLICCYWDLQSLIISHLVTGRPVHSAAMSVLRLLSGRPVHSLAVSVLRLLSGRPVHSPAMSVLRLLNGPKMFFFAHRCDALPRQT